MMWNRAGDRWVAQLGHYTAAIKRHRKRAMFRWGRYSWTVSRPGYATAGGESKSLKKAMTACEAIAGHGNRRTTP